MRRRIAAVGCLAWFVLAINACARCDDSAIGVLRNKPADLAGAVEHYQRTRDLGALQKAVVTADEAVREAMERLLQNAKSWSTVKQHTEGLVTWREWPEDLTFRKAARFHLDGEDDANPVINYRHYQAPEGTELVVFQNSFRSLRGARVAPTLYALVGRPDGTRSVAHLQVPGASTIGFEIPPYLLGFIQTGTSVPDLVVLQGPYGSGQFWHCYLYSYDSARETWTHRKVLKYSGASDLSYAEQANEITYKCSVYSESAAKARIEKRTFRFCDRRGPLKLRLPEASHAPLGGPVLIEATVQNTSERAVRIRGSFSDERQLVPRRLEVTVRRRDGTPLRRVPKDALVWHEDTSGYVTLKPKEEYAFRVDLAKVREGLTSGEYTVSFMYVNRSGEDCFRGLVQSNQMELTIGEVTSSSAPCTEPSRNAGP